MKKKIVTAVLMLTACAAVFAGCANTSKEGPEGDVPVGTEASTTPEPTGTIVTPEPTKEVSPTPEPTPTSEPTPVTEPTPTPEPTKKPEITPTATSGGVVLCDYTGLSLESISWAEVDRVINLGVLVYYAEYEAVERAARQGDSVTVNYEVTLRNGEPDSEFGENETDILLGSGYFLPELENALVGMSAGESKEFQLVLSEDFLEYAGEQADCWVEVVLVTEVTLPELTDAFVSEYLYEGITVAEYRKMMYENLREEYLFAQVITYLNENCYSIHGEELTEEMIIAAVAEREGIVLSKEEYETRATEYANMYGYKNLKAFEKDFSQKAIEEVILYDLVIEYILESAIIVDEE